MAGRFTVEVSGDVAGVVTMPRQIRFASVKAVNDTLPIAQDNVRGDLDAEYHIRGRWMEEGNRFGIKKRNARFADAKPEGSVFTKADWLLEHEGYNLGVKKPEPGGEHLADPEDPVTRGPIGRKMPVAQKARRLLEGSQGRISPKTGKLIGKTGAFIIRPKSNPRIELVFQRVGVQKKTGDVRKNKFGVPLRGSIRAGSRLVLKHVLVPSVKVERKMVFTNSVRNTVKVHYGVRLNMALRGALRGARIRGTRT